jgi:hypothetical protein
VNTGMKRGLQRLSPTIYNALSLMSVHHFFENTWQ